MVKWYNNTNSTVYCIDEIINFGKAVNKLFSLDYKREKHKDLIK